MVYHKIGSRVTKYNTNSLHWIDSTRAYQCIDHRGEVQPIEERCSGAYPTGDRGATTIGNKRQHELIFDNGHFVVPFAGKEWSHLKHNSNAHYCYSYYFSQDRCFNCAVEFSFHRDIDSGSCDFGGEELIFSCCWRGGYCGVYKPRRWNKPRYRVITP